jgi:hypothetical protein
MWLYLGPSCPDRSLSEELSDVEINTRVDHGANLNTGAGPAPLREGVASTRVSLFGSILATCTISSSHRAHDLHRVTVMHQPARGRVEGMRTPKEKEKTQSAAHQGVRERGEDTLTESDSSEEDGEVTPPPLSLPRTTPLPFGDTVGRQVRIANDGC